MSAFRGAAKSAQPSSDAQRLSLIDGGPVELPPSVWCSLQKSFKQYPERDAVIAMHQDPSHLSALVGGLQKSKYLTLTYEQLLEGALCITAAIQKAGVKQGATIATLIPNGAEYCLIRLAIVLSKTNLASLDVGAVQPARQLELQNFLTQLKPDVIVVADAAAAASVDAAIAATGHKVSVKLNAHWDKAVAIPQGWADLEQVNHGQFIDRETRDAIWADALVDDHDRVAVTLFTSGTSIGRPKGCPRTVRNMLYTLDPVPPQHTAHQRYLVDTANFRAICSVVSTGVWLNGGCLIWSGPAPSPAGAIKAYKELQPTDGILVPAMLKLVTAHPSFTPEVASCMRTIASGGDVVTRKVLELADSKFSNARAVNVHGMSEGGNLFDWSFCHKERRYFGEVPAFGSIMPGARLKVVDEHGNIVPRGTPGELHIDSPGTIPHYIDYVQPETFYRDGEVTWFRTGDTTIIDEEGYTYIIGRSKDIIKRAAIPITPLVLETCLSAYTGAETAVIGIEHPILGAVPYAILSHYGGKSPAELKARVVEMMGPDYALEGVVALEQLGFGAWPLNATDKVNKVELKAALLRSLSVDKP